MISQSVEISRLSSTSVFFTAHMGASEDAELLRDEFDKLQTHVAIPESSPYGKILSDIESVYLEACEEDWDGYGASTPNFTSKQYAIVFAWLLPLGIPAPEVNIDPDGEFSFDWYKGPRKTISVSISDRGELNYAYLIGPNKGYGVEILDCKIPDTILSHIGRIYS